jgi:PTH1 family peptidyl-tRNA hydrolase
VVTLAGRRVALAVPTTYMNDSGSSVRSLATRFGIDEPASIVIVHDELDLPPGTVRLKAGGGLAGHNGLRSVQSHLHSSDFLRVRIGVGKPPSAAQGASHVLRRPPKAVRELLGASVQTAADAVERIVADGMDAAVQWCHSLPT